MPCIPRKNFCTAVLWLLLGSVGCNFVPDIRHQPQFHNPFPQLQTVAVLPFRNQSQEPTLSGSRVSLAYYNELQSIPGFEVLPNGVVEAGLRGFESEVLRRPISSPDDFQRFAKYLGVDAVLQGSITDFSQYYPPRLTLKVNWYSANEGFYPVPPGYGLPWGTKDEAAIPETVRLEAERALAREQLKTQTPIVQNPRDEVAHHSTRTKRQTSKVKPASAETLSTTDQTSLSIDELQIPSPMERLASNPSESMEQLPRPEPEATSLEEPSILETNVDVVSLPEKWPDPQGFIPPAPQTTRPLAQAQSAPIISHMKAYNGHDEDFTEQLSDYYYFRDDARFGGWEAYLQRSEDFIRFCCHQHIVETLAARGGQLKSRTVVRWPIDRYER
jgi:hypothetical protein